MAFDIKKQWWIFAVLIVIIFIMKPQFKGIVGTDPALCSDLYSYSNVLFGRDPPTYASRLELESTGQIIYHKYDDMVCVEYSDTYDDDICIETHIQRESLCYQDTTLCECAVVDCSTLKTNALNSIVSWANNPTSPNKQTALNSIVSWAGNC